MVGPIWVPLVKLCKADKATVAVEDNCKQNLSVNMNRIGSIRIPSSNIANAGTTMVTVTNIFTKNCHGHLSDLTQILIALPKLGNTGTA